MMKSESEFFDESELLPISSLQHYAFCKRQYALIYIERIWNENTLTAEGRIMHERVHDRQNSGFENGILVMRSLPLRSLKLGLYGVADVVEFIPSEKGVKIFDYDGKYIPQPVEYKRGKSKFNDCDRVQLCAQALCLEEMLGCHIESASIFYGEPRRREKVVLDKSLRDKTKGICEEVHLLHDKGITPKPVYTNACKRCSILDQCNPKVVKRSAREYWQDALLFPGDDSI